jgi:predicted phosphodiesterase
MKTSMLVSGWATVIFCILIIVASSGVSYAGFSREPGFSGSGIRASNMFSFVVLSDRTGGHQPGHWAAAIREVNRLHPDFVICVGDLIEGYTTNRAIIDAQWTEFTNLTRKLDAPFFFCPGNHDLYSSEQTDEYLTRFSGNGKTYYSFNYRNCHFVVFDSFHAMGDARFRKEQQAWLEKDINAARLADHIFVFFHHPQCEPANTNSLFRAGYLSVLPRDKTTIFNGHTHYCYYDDSAGIPVCVLPSTGSWADQTGERMYAYVTVADGKPEISVINLHNILPAEHLEFSEQLMGLRPEPLSAGIPPSGGVIPLKMLNPLDVPVKATIMWHAENWAVTPVSRAITLQPGTQAVCSFDLKPVKTNTPAPVMHVSYSVPRPGRLPYTYTRKRTLQVSEAYEKTLTTGKPFTTSLGPDEGRYARYAIDGMADKWSAWWAYPSPQWLSVDLEKLFLIDTVIVIPHWNGSRYYQYAVSVSPDGKEWTEVVDMRTNTTPATAKGVFHRFTPVEARYIKITMLKKNAKESIHLVELRAYEAKQ